MQGWEVFLIVLLILLVLAGVIVTIYFILKHDDKKNKQMQPSNGGNNNTGNTGSNPIGTRPNPPNTNPISTTSFASSQKTGDITLTWGVSKPSDSLFLALIPITSDPNFPCKNYLFDLQNGSLVWQGDGESVIIGSLAPGGSVLVVKRANIPTSGFTSIWVYDENAKTWCAQENQNLCIQYSPSSVPGATGIVMNTLTNDASFKWDKVSPLPDTNIPCSTQS